MKLGAQMLAPAAAGGPGSAPSFDLNALIAALLRRRRIFIITAGIIFALGVIVTLLLPKVYTASADVLLDQHKQNIVEGQQVVSDLPADQFSTDTEVEVLKSRELAEKVVASQRLDRDPFFNPALPQSGVKGVIQAVSGVLKPIKNAFSTPLGPAVAAQVSHEKVTDSLMKRLRVTRSGLTYVIGIGVAADGASKSARIANAFADQYLTAQLDAKFDATQHAAEFLNGRLAGLQAQMEQADAAVAQYKAANGGLLSGDNNNTLTQQEVSNLDAQLATAKAAQAEQNGKLAAARSQLARGGNGEDLGAALDSPVIQQLRAQRGQLSSQVADLQTRYGARHPELLRAESEVTDIDKQIQGEIQRIISNLEAQQQVADQRAASLAGSLAQSRGTLASNSIASVKLNELERDADSARTTYQTYLDRFKQANAQQGVEQSDARIISRAKIPISPSSPLWLLSLPLSLIAGLAAGSGCVLLAELRSTGLFTAADVEDALETTSLGSIPLLSSVAAMKRGSASPEGYVVDQPHSLFVESYRSLRMTAMSSMDTREGGTVLAFTSALVGEGKTTTSICVARVAAISGARVVMVDCDLRRRAMSHVMPAEAVAGLVEVLDGRAALKDVLLTDPLTGASMLLLSNAPLSAKEAFERPEFRALLKELRESFELVVLDLPPVLAVTDAAVIAAQADTTVCLVRWRQTPRQAVGQALKRLAVTDANVAGVALTLVDIKEQARSGYGDSDYYVRSYGAYFAPQADESHR